MNVLLAEDDRDDCNFFKIALEVMPLPTHLTTVHDGEQAMKHLSENSEHLPDIIFLDVNMPRKDGLECLVEIKENEKLKNIPVVMLSTSRDQDKIRNSFELGANIYIRKPGDFSELAQAIHHALPIAIDNKFSKGKLKYILNA